MPVVNTLFMLSVRYEIRVLITVGLLTMGLVGIAVSVYIDFWFAIASIAVVGSASCFGER